MPARNLRAQEKRLTGLRGRPFRQVASSFLASVIIATGTGPNPRGAQQEQIRQTPPTAVEAGANEAPLSLEEATDLALAANRTLAAARLRREVARGGIDVARERPNPDLTLESERETPHEALTLALPIETASKRRRRIDLASAEAGTGEAEIDRLTVETRNLVRRAYYALAASQRRVAETEELLRIAGKFREAASARFEAGAAPRLEVLQAKLAAAQADNEVNTARGSLRSARTDLNTLLARPPEHPTTISGELDAGAFPEAEAAAEQALLASTELEVLDRRIAEAQARVDLARARQFPDPTVQGTVTRRSAPEFNTGWRAGVTVTLPLFTRHRAEVIVEQRSLSQLRAEREAVAARIRGDVFAAVAVAGAQRQQYVRYRDQILPQAAEIERMAEDSYQSGQTGLVAMLQTLQTTREVRLRSVQAGLDYQVALAELERAIGAPLP